eukprot:scaffold3806_cov41-Cyclotella_meneghiniana.AAC.2
MNAFPSLRQHQTLSSPSTHSPPPLPSFLRSNLQFVRPRCHNHARGVNVLDEERGRRVCGVQLLDQSRIKSG